MDATPTCFDDAIAAVRDIEARATRRLEFKAAMRREHGARIGGGLAFHAAASSWADAMALAIGLASR